MIGFILGEKEAKNTILFCFCIQTLINNINNKPGIGFMAHRGLPRALN